MLHPLQQHVDVARRPRGAAPSAAAQRPRSHRCPRGHVTPSHASTHAPCWQRSPGAHVVVRHVVSTQVPRGQRCRAGRRSDPCAGIVCYGNEVCDDRAELSTAGQCVAGCQCRPCAAGQACAPDGRCVDEGCLDVTCPMGSVCEQGACVDRCASPGGARLCLEDEVCREGSCVSARDATPDDAGGVSLDSGVRGPMAMDPSGCGCGCGVGGGARSPMGSALVGLGWVLARRRRRRSVD